MTHVANELIPRRAVLAVALGLAVLLVTLALREVNPVSTSGGVTTPNGTTPNGTTPNIANIGTRTLHFRDRSDGGIDVVDATTLRLVETLHGELGFVRGTLRSFARERKRHGVSGEAPLHLRREGQAVLLSDPATGLRMPLQAFGPTNVGVFARWLD